METSDRREVKSMAEYRKQKEKDLYAILGVPKTADEAQIKKAYRKLAKKYHPDMNTGNTEAENRFKDISEANAILSDAEKRKIYDEFGYAAFESGMDPKEYAKRMKEAQAAGFGHGGAGSYGGFRGFGPDGFEGAFGGFGGGRGGFGNGKGGKTGFFHNGDGSYTSFHFEGGEEGDYGNLFEELLRNAGAGGAAAGAGGFGQGGSRTGSFFTGGSRGSTGGYTGAGGFGGASGFQENAQNLDAEIPVRVSFEESVLGCDRNIRLQKEDGSGTQTLRVRIPAGIADGKTVRLRGKGHVSADGNRRGDLLLRVSVDEDRNYSRKGQDLYTSVSVPFTTAVLGGEAQVQLPGGKKIMCKVPAGTDAGKKIRIRGKGVHAEKSSAMPGDLYVTVQVQVPADLTDAEIRKLREFEAMVDARRKGQERTA